MLRLRKGYISILKYIPFLVRIILNFLDELEYSSDEVDNKSINRTINKCKHYYSMNRVF